MMEIASVFAHWVTADNQGISRRATADEDGRFCFAVAP
jgi:hypothetical protein